MAGAGRLSTHPGATTRAAVRAILARLGLRVTRYTRAPSPFVARARLLRELDVDVVLDIGANAGQYGAGLREAGYAGRIVSVEPLAAAFEQLHAATLDDALWDCHRLALGDRSGDAMLHVSRNLASSSLLDLRPRSERAAPESAFVGSEHVEVVSLDGAREALLGNARQVWLKLDVQGGERAVLDGAEATLADVEAIDVELSVVELYRGQALFGEVVERLSACGFGLRWLEPTWHDPESREILQLDGVFVRRDRDEPDGRGGAGT